MKDYQYILFDLDGTITESGPGIMNSVEYALNRLGIDVGDRDGLRRFIGPPLVDSMMQFYGTSGKKQSAEWSTTGNTMLKKVFLKIRFITVWRKCWGS